MHSRVLQLSFFFTLFLAAAVLTFFLFLPYLPALFFATVVAIVFWPLHRSVARSLKHRFSSALVSTVLVILLIGLPLALFSLLLFQEVSALYTEATRSGGDLLNISAWMQQFAESVRTLSPSFADVLLEQSRRVDQAGYLTGGLNWILANLRGFFTEFVHILLSFALGVLALFYMFHGGSRALQYLKEISPLSPEHDERLMDRCAVAVNSVIRGRVLASIIQGVLAGIAFAITGVPAPVLWGSVAGVISVIPMLGPGLVITPAVIYLFVTGSMWAAIGLLIWAFVAVYFIDDILEPVFIHRGIQVHPMLILISILGGLTLMGPVGFVAGPVILSVFFALLQMYPIVVKQANGNTNHPPYE